MKKIYLLATILGAFFFFSANASAITSDWGGGAGESTSLPCTVAPCSDEYKLTADITLTGITVRNGSSINTIIDLNGHSITTNDAIALVGGSSLTIKDSAGGGFIRSTAGDRGVIYIEGSGYFTIESGTITSTVVDAPGLVAVKGAETPAENVVIVNIGKDAVLQYEGLGYGHGVTVDRRANNKSYGVVVNINGTVDVTQNGDQAAVYVNGLIQDTVNAPIINIGSTAKLSGAGPGIYAAGYAYWTIESGASVTGVDSALGIKSGKFVINGGTFTATGPDGSPTSGRSNGINASGAAIQIEGNASYLGDVDLTINGGTFVSQNGRVFYEYLAANATDTAVDSVAIKGGTFVANNTGLSDVFMLSQEFADAITGFVSGGTFSTNPTAYLASGLTYATDSNGNFVVAASQNTTDDGKQTANPDTSDINLILIIAGASVGVAGVLFTIRKLSKSIR